MKRTMISLVVLLCMTASGCAELLTTSGQMTQQQYQEHRLRQMEQTVEQMERQRQCEKLYWTGHGIVYPF